MLRRDFPKTKRWFDWYALGTLTAFTSYKKPKTFFNAFRDIKRSDQSTTDKTLPSQSERVQDMKQRVKKLIYENK